MLISNLVPYYYRAYHFVIMLPPNLCFCPVLLTESTSTQNQVTAISGTHSNED